MPRVRGVRLLQECSCTPTRFCKSCSWWRWKQSSLFARHRYWASVPWVVR